MKKEKKDKHFIHKPIYPGGIKAMRTFIKENLQYPKEALENHKEGTVKIRYDIDYKGKVIDVHILKGLGYGCDEEAERLVRMFRFEVEKNRKVKVVFHRNIQIHFKLPKQKPKPTPKPESPKVQKIVYNYTTVKTSPEPTKSINNSYTYQIKLN